MHDVDAVVHERPPGLAVAVYAVIGEPPFDAGGDHETRTEASPAEAFTPVGAPGTVRGVAAREFDVAPAPAAFTARMVTEVLTPLVSSEMVKDPVA